MKLVDQRILRLQNCERVGREIRREETKARQSLSPFESIIMRRSTNFMMYGTADQRILKPWNSENFGRAACPCEAGQKEENKTELRIFYKYSIMNSALFYFPLCVCTHAANSFLSDIPTGLFSIWEPQEQEVGELHLVQERRETDFGAQKLWKGRAGCLDTLPKKNGYDWNVSGFFHIPDRTFYNSLDSKSVDRRSPIDPTDANTI